MTFVYVMEGQDYKHYCHGSKLHFNVDEHELYSTPIHAFFAPNPNSLYHVPALHFFHGVPVQNSH